MILSVRARFHAWCNPLPGLVWWWSPFPGWRARASLTPGFLPVHPLRGYGHHNCHSWIITFNLSVRLYAVPRSFPP